MFPSIKTVPNNVLHTYTKQDLRLAKDAKKPR